MHRPAVLTKTSLMLGLGETDAEIRETMADLRSGGGRYPHPGPVSAADAESPDVERFVSPEEFDAVSRLGARAGIPGVRVRSLGALELSRRAGARAQQRGLDETQRAVEQRAGPEAFMSQSPLIRHLGLVPYETTWRAMQRFTDERDAATRDEIWLLEHPPVFTLGPQCEPRAPARAGRYPGGADRSRRPGDLSRAGPARGLSAHRLCGASRSACASWWWRWRTP